MTQPNISGDEAVQSGTLKMRRFLDSRLDTLRRQNDEIMREDARAMLIGEIKATVRLLKFIDTRPLVVADESAFKD